MIHLILSDIHQNDCAFFGLVKKARSKGGFDDIWLLGDLFGHSQLANGVAQISDGFVSVLSFLASVPCQAVWGNWEYWLKNPILGVTDNGSHGHSTEIKQIRRELQRLGLRKYLELFSEKFIAEVPCRPPHFSLFHGCCCVCVENDFYAPKPWESYLYPKDVNFVTRSLFLNAENLRTPHFAFGHTHIAGFFQFSLVTQNAIWRHVSPKTPEKTYHLNHESIRYGINPGAVGDTAPSAVLYDEDAQYFRYIFWNADSNS